MLLEGVADREVAVLRRVEVPLHRVAAGPVAEGAGADGERHLDPVAGVEARAAHLGQFPARPEIARPHLGVALEAAGGEHHRGRAQLVDAPPILHLDAVDLEAVVQQAGGAAAVADLDPALARRLRFRLDQAGAAAPGLHRQAAPELELAVHLEGLPAPDRLEAHALAAQPLHGLEGAAHQDLAQLGMGAVAGDAEHVVEELVLGVGAEVALRHLGIRQVGHDLAQILDTVIGEADGAGGEAGVAAGLVLGRALQHHHPRALLLGRERGAEGGVAAAHHDDVELVAAAVPGARRAVRHPHPPGGVPL